MPMRCAKPFLAALWVLAVCAGCGGGSSSVTTYTGGGSGTGAGTTVSVDTPVGSNTTEVLVDSGPASFSLGAANIPYVSVTVCAPNSGAVSASNCVTIDHVFLDTGSYGLRVLKSSVAKLALPAVTLAANPALNAPAGTAVECYPFVLGGVWGPLARADVHMAGETAPAIPIQVIDDTPNAPLTAPADCLAAADGSLFSTAASLQANGILGIGMMGFDCGLSCTIGDYAGFHVQYYACPDALTANCKPAAVASAQQMQNPVVHFVPDDGNPQPDNNGSIIRLPALPTLGASVAKGRLVFGIGTRANNQIAPGATMLMADANPASASYLYLTTSMGGSVFADSYIDSGSNAFFFNDASISLGCKSSVGPSTLNGWYCPPVATPATRNATLSDSLGNSAPVAFSIHNADALFSGSSTAFGNLGGSITLAPRSFVWGLSFFYGRSVYTSIWGQALSPNGPWNAF
jgi:hypothetical protein